MLGNQETGSLSCVLVKNIAVKYTFLIKAVIYLYNQFLLSTYYVLNNNLHTSFIKRNLKKQPVIVLLSTHSTLEYVITGTI